MNTFRKTDGRTDGRMDGQTSILCIIDIKTFCRRALEKRMIHEPDALWIIKPPGGNNGTGVR